MIIFCDPCQFWNQGLHLPTGPLALAVASQLSLIELVNKWRNCKGDSYVAQSIYYLFSDAHTPTILHASDIITKTNWVEMVRLAGAAYEEPDCLWRQFSVGAAFPK